MQRVLCKGGVFATVKACGQRRAANLVAPLQQQMEPCWDVCCAQSIRARPSSRPIAQSQYFSTGTVASEESVAPSFAAIDHSQAYEAALDGLHGNQLELARMEGYGKDDAPFDPFAMDEEIDTLLDQAIEKAAAAQQENETDDMALDDSTRESEADTRTTSSAVPPEDVVDAETEKDDDAFTVTRVAADSAEESNDAEEMRTMPAMYNNDGSLRRKKSQLALLRAGYPGGGLFAVVSLAGSQHKITTDDVLIVNLLKPVTKFKVGSIHTLKDQDVLLVGSTHYTLLGMPYVQGAEVDVLVEEITKDAKVIVFKKRRRKHSQRKNGFRRDVTMLRVLDIRPPAAFSEQYHTPRLESDMMIQEDDVAVA